MTMLEELREELKKNIHYRKRLEEVIKEIDYRKGLMNKKEEEKPIDDLSLAHVKMGRLAVEIMHDCGIEIRNVSFNWDYAGSVKVNIESSERIRYADYEMEED